VTAISSSLSFRIMRLEHPLDEGVAVEDHSFAFARRSELRKVSRAACT